MMVHKKNKERNKERKRKYFVQATAQADYTLCHV
jgi:hypothetical protein